MNDDTQGLALLALLDRYHADLAAGLHRDLAEYYAATPELETAFLELALSADIAANSSWDSWDASETPPIQTLAPGVSRALASLPGFADDMPNLAGTAGSKSSQQRLVAEERASYTPSSAQRQNDDALAETDDE
jgi:hypothetical protein